MPWFPGGAYAGSAHRSALHAADAGVAASVGRIAPLFAVLPDWAPLRLDPLPGRGDAIVHPDGTIAVLEDGVLDVTLGLAVRQEYRSTLHVGYAVNADPTIAVAVVSGPDRATIRFPVSLAAHDRLAIKVACDPAGQYQPTTILGGLLTAELSPPG